MFGNKKNAAKSGKGKATQPKKGATKARKSGGKLDKDLMSNVLGETNVIGVLDQVRNNGDEFVSVYKNGAKQYVAFALDINTIIEGGFARKNRRNQDLSAIIAEIENNDIIHIIDATLMANEGVAIIPTPVTLRNIKEYSLLTKPDTDYNLAFVDTNTGKISITSNMVNIKDVIAKTIDESAMTVAQYVTGNPAFKGVNWLHEPGALNGDETTVIPPVEETGVDVVDGENIPSVDDVLAGETKAAAERDAEPAGMVVGDGDYEEYLPVEEDSESQEAPSAPQEQPAEVVPAAPAPQVQNVSESAVDANQYEELSPQELEEAAQDEGAVEDEEGEEEEVTPAQIRGTIVRKFFSEDLDLEVSTAAFDLEYVHANEMPQFPTDFEGDGFLARNINASNAQFNAQMRKLHTDNIILCQNRFMNYMNGYERRIVDQLDTTAIPDEKHFYAIMKASLDNDRKNARANAAKMVADRRKEMSSVYEKSKKETMQAAAVAAGQAYEEHYGHAHQAALQKVESTVQHEIDDVYYAAIREMNALRKQEAHSVWEVLQITVLEEVSAYYNKLREQENKQYELHAQRIDEFIEDNRSNNIYETRALREQLKRDRTLDEMRAQMETEMETRLALKDHEIEDAKAQIEQVRKDGDLALKESVAHYAERLKSAEELRIAADNQLKDAEKRYQKEMKEHDKVKDRQMELVYKDNERLTNASKSSNIVWSIVVCIVAVIIGVGGYVVGSTTGTHDVMNNVSSQISSDTQKKLNEKSSYTSDNGADSNSQYTDKDFAKAKN